MEKKRLIINQNSPLLHHKSVLILHKYKNGEALIEYAPLMAQDWEITSSEVIKSGLQFKESSLRIESDTKSNGTLQQMNNEDVVMAYIELIGPTEAQWLKEIAGSGIELIRYQPRYSYFSKGKVESYKAILEKTYVDEIRVVEPDLKKQDVVIQESGFQDVIIVAMSVEGTNDSVIQILQEIPGVEIDKDAPIEQLDYFIKIKAKVDGQGYRTLLDHHQIIALEEYQELILEGEIANLILAGEYQGNSVSGSYLNWLKSKRVNGEGVTIAIVDAGVDVNHDAFNGRINDLAGGEKHWHGTMVAGHAAGNYRVEKDEQGYIYGLGVAPNAELLSISNSHVNISPQVQCSLSISNSGPSGYKTYIQNNSWGAGTKNPMDYGSLEAAYDRLVRNSSLDPSKPEPLIICFSAGNSGDKGLTRPKAAKNIIVTGNSESLRSIGGNFSDHIDDVYQNPDWQPSSHGNCGDGRVRPHIVAPGEWTSSANYGINDEYSIYVSPKIVWGGGTSGASPKTAGVCALIVQWWRKQNMGTYPSPAMVKALLINSAEPMYRSVSKPPVPSKLQGWGRLNAGNIFKSDLHTSYIDQSIILKERGQAWSRKFMISDPSQPIKITLTWTDPPGNINTGDSLSNTCIVNSLNLIVKVNGKEFHGNNFSNGWSRPGDFSNPQLKGSDNSQNVFLEPGSVSGSFEVAVEALNITTNCFDFSTLNPEQDFALVVQNGFLDKNQTPMDLFLIIDDLSSSDSDNYNFWDPEDDEWEDISWLEDGQVEDDEDSSDDYGDDWWNDDSFNWEESGLILESGSSSKKMAISTQEELDITIGLEISKRELSKQTSNPELEFSTQIKDYASRSLHQKITKLQSSWKQDLEKSVGVIAIGKDSKFNNITIAAIKQLCFQGELYFVSSYAPALSILARFLGENKNVHYRYAESEEGLSYLLKNTLIEASGGTRLNLRKTVEDTEEVNKRSLYLFNTIQEDTKVVLHLSRYEEGPLKLALKSPDKSRHPINIGDYSVKSNHRKGISVVHEPEKLIITISLNAFSGQTDGIWQILYEGPSELEVNAWCWSDLDFKVSAKPMPIPIISRDADHENVKLRLTARAIPDAKLSEINYTTHFIVHKNNTGIFTESKLQSVSVKPKKMIPTEAQMLESAETESLLPFVPPPVFNFDHIFTVMQVGKNSLAELIINLEGMTKNQQSFQRQIRENIFLAPSKLESGVIKRRAKEHFIAAKVTKAYYQNNKLMALRLKSRIGERDFKILDEKLRSALETIDLQSDQLHFGLKGSVITRAIMTY